MQIQSEDFSHGEMLPERFTQFGEDISPQLTISDVPAAAKSVVLICSDPDAPDPAAPQRVFTHWVLYNLPAKNLELPAGADIRSLFPHAAEGMNDKDRLGYVGPKPPIGTHRYYFKAYAVMTRFEKKGLTRKQVLEAIDGKVVGMAEIMGRFPAR